MDDYDNAGPIMRELCSTAKKTFIYLSYGEFDGLRVPAIAELYVLRGLIDGAIAEQREADRARSS